VLTESPSRMVITLTLGELVAAEDPLTRLLEVRVNAQLAYQLAKMAKAVRAETKHFHEQRDDYVRELGEPVPPDQANGATGAMRVKVDLLEEFGKRIAELTAVEAILDIRPLALSALPEISGADLLRLGRLVDGDA
jgi:hypothetical protein